jgi:hypothetical protein
VSARRRAVSFFPIRRVGWIESQLEAGRCSSRGKRERQLDVQIWVGELPGWDGMRRGVNYSRLRNDVGRIGVQ